MERSADYDAIGNLTAKDGAAVVYHPTKPHRVLGVAGSSGYTFDANGNQAIQQSD